MPHRTPRSPSMEEPLLKGWVARESGVVERLLNKRYAALYPSRLVTFRKQDDDQPSKAFQLSRHAAISPVKQHKYRLRHAKTSTLYALAAGAYDEVDMYGFTVQFGSGEKLALAFPEQQEAQRWHDVLESTIGRLRSQSSSGTITPRSDSNISTLSAASAPGTPSGSPGAVSSQALRVEAMPTKGPTVHEVIAERVQQPAPVPVPEGVERRRRAWQSIMHINGVAVFLEDVDDEGEGGAVMVSAVVRAPPADIFKQIVHVRKREAPTGIFTGARTVEMLDARTAVVAQTWQAAGVMRHLCVPRQLCLLRTWRKDEDGTFIVLFQSTQHPSVPEPDGGWRAPVRVHCEAAGFTVAPLMPQLYSRRDGEEDAAEASPESLVTLVFNADLGGFLSDHSTLGRLFWPLADAATRAVLEPVVTSIVFLREHLEQSRFVVRPVSTFGLLEEEGQPSAGERAAQQAQRERLVQRSVTMLTYRPGPLLVKQRETMRRMSMRAPTMAPAAEPASAEEAAEEEEAAAAWAVGGTCPPQFWSSPGDAGFKVRGPDYLTTKKKIPAAMPMLDLVSVDLIKLEEPLFNAARYLPSIKFSPAPWLLCIQLMVPAVPPVSLVASFAAPFAVYGQDADSLIQQWEREHAQTAPNNVRAFFQALAEFVNSGDDAARNKKFKLVPRISQGSWIIKQSVGTTPVLLGQKLTTKYFSTPKYLEVDVDIGSSSVAASVTNLVCGATKSLVIDLGVLIEGQTPDQLPEQLIGTVRLSHLDLGTAAYLDEATGRLCKPGELCT